MFNIDYIKEFRKEKKLTVEEFCKKCKITKGEYYRFLKGDLTINPYVLIEICHLTNKKPSFYLGSN